MLVHIGAVALATCHVQLHLPGVACICPSSAHQRPSTHKHLTCSPLSLHSSSTVAAPHLNRPAWLCTTERTWLGLGLGLGLGL